jgi:hypothetical protein
MEKGSSDSLRLQSDVFPVIPGETITEALWTKETIAGGSIVSLGIITGATAGAAQLFSGGQIQDKTFLSNANWQRFSADFVIPAGHFWARLDCPLWFLAPQALRVLVDKTEIIRRNFIPWINMDGTTAGTSSIFSANWTNYLSHQKPSYRKVDDVVELQGLALANAGAGATLCTLPVGYRPIGEQLFAILANGTTAMMRVDVQTDGQVILSAAPTAGGYYSLSGIRFSTL